MVGYGAEDSHFVLELTYNYGIGRYQLGNDFQVCLYAARLYGDILTIAGESCWYRVLNVACMFGSSGTSSVLSISY